MKATFAKVMVHVFAHEGGYVDDPRDPGGATRYGITLKTLSDWRGWVVSKADVKALTKDEAQAIYHANYWDAVSGDELPAGVDYAVFDYAVNSGPGRAAKDLQKVLGVTVDGIIGPITLRAANTAIPRFTIEDLCDERLAFLKNLKTWPTYGKGWTRRVTEVRDVALSLASGGIESPTTGWLKPALAAVWRFLTAIWKGRRK